MPKKSQPFFQKPFLVSFLVVAALFLLEFLGFTPFFHVNDDHWALFISNGVGIGLTPDEHLFYNNVILGFILKALYLWVPQGNWYPFLLILVQFLGFWAILSGALLRSREKISVLFFLAVFFLVDFYFFEQLNYTMTCALAFLGGMLLFPNLAKEKDPSVRFAILALSASCLILSSFLRWEEFLFCGLISFPFLLFTLFENKWKTNDLLKLSAIVLVIGSCVLFDHAYYRFDPSWKSFPATNRALGPNLAWTHFDYNAGTKPFFDAVDWSENDLKLFKDWYFLEERYAAPKVDALARHFTHSPTSLYRDGLPLFRGYIQGNMALCLFTFLLFCPVRKIGLVLFNSLWVAAAILYLADSAWAPLRVVLPALVFPVYLALYYAIPPRRSSKQAEKTLTHSTPAIPYSFLFVLFLVAIPAFKTFRTWNHELRTVDVSVENEVRRLQPKPDQLYVLWDSYFCYEAISALNSYEIFRDFRIFALAPFQLSPIGRGMLDHFKVKNLFSDMVDRPDLFLVCSSREGEMYRQYMREKHHLEIYPEKTFDGPFFKVFRIHSKPPGKRGWPKEISSLPGR